MYTYVHMYTYYVYIYMYVKPFITRRMTGFLYIRLPFMPWQPPRPEKRGIPGFRARHQKMKAEWSEKWNSAKEEEWGDEDWGEEGWDEDGWDEGGDWEEAW